MVEKDENDRKTRICMELSTYEMPPSGNILVLGKRCALGPNAAKNMLDSVLPDRFEVVNLKDDILDSILIKKHLFHMGG